MQDCNHFGRCNYFHLSEPFRLIVVVMQEPILRLCRREFLSEPFGLFPPSNASPINNFMNSLKGCDKYTPMASPWAPQANSIAELCSLLRISPERICSLKGCNRFNIATISLCDSLRQNYRFLIEKR